MRKAFCRCSKNYQDAVDEREIEQLVIGALLLWVGRNCKLLMNRLDT